MNNNLKNKVKHLRSEGLTYTEINKEIGKNVSKSTLNYWCQGVKLPEFYSQKVININSENLNKARKKALITNRKIQQERIDRILKYNYKIKEYINSSTSKIMLSMLYLGEGAKYSSTRYLKFGSSSTYIIKLYLKLLNNCYTLNKDKFRANILCRADQNINKLENYWQNITNIDSKLFYKSRIDKRTIGKKTLKKDYKGVCVIMYFDTNIQLELELLSKQLLNWI